MKTYIFCQDGDGLSFKHCEPGSVYSWKCWPMHDSDVSNNPLTSLSSLLYIAACTGNVGRQSGRK